MSHAEETVDAALLEKQLRHANHEREAAWEHHRRTKDEMLKRMAALALKWKRDAQQWQTEDRVPSAAVGAQMVVAATELEALAQEYR